MENVFAVIAAGGCGSRMGSSLNKQLMLLEGKPVLLRTMEAFNKHPQVSRFIVVAGKSIIPRIKEMASDNRLDKFLAVLPGGAARQDSVKSGLDFLSSLPEITPDSLVLVHDGARCLVSEQVISRVISGISVYGACGAAVKVKDTIKTADLAGKITGTPDRRYLWAMQTPQGSNMRSLKAAYDLAYEQGWRATDDLAMLEQAHQQVYIVEGEEKNIKITTPVDMVLARALLATD